MTLPKNIDKTQWKVIRVAVDRKDYLKLQRLVKKYDRNSMDMFTSSLLSGQLRTFINIMGEKNYHEPEYITHYTPEEQQLYYTDYKAFEKIMHEKQRAEQLRDNACKKCGTQKVRIDTGERIFGCQVVKSVCPKCEAKSNQAVN